MKDLSVKVFLKSIVVHEKQYPAKEYAGDEIFAAIESGSIYVLNGKWRVKGKKISNVFVEETSIVITTDDSKFTFQKLSKRDHNSSKWELFCNQCTKMAKRNKCSEQEITTIPKIKHAISKGQSHTGGNILRNSNAATSSKSSLRRRGIFGKTGKNMNGDISTMPWDDGIDKENVYSTKDSDSFETSSEVKPDLLEVTDRATPTLEEETSKPKMEPFDTVMQQSDALAAQMSPEASIDVGNMKGRRKLSKLSATNGRPDESDTDDDGIFNETADDAEMTTPIAQRIVSPAGTLSTEHATNSIGSDDSLRDKCNAEAKSKKIDSFFRPRKNKCAETPPPNNLPTETVTESVKRRKNSLQEDDDWLRRSPGLVSSTGNRPNIFGKHHDSSALSPKYETISKIGNIFDDSNTFISNVESEPRTSRLKRPRLKEQQSTNASHVMEPSAQSPSLPTSPSSAFVLTPARADFHFRGLRNLGNTCYLNASLQMLLSCFSIINSLRRYHGLLTSSLLAVADGLSVNTGKWNSFNPSIVKEAMDNMTDKFYGYEQRDAHEFLNDLIDHLHEELEVEASAIDKLDNFDVTSKSDNIAIPTNDFCLTARVMLKCTSCGYSRSKEEMYRNLSIDIVTTESDDAVKLNASVGAGLAHFFQPETREIKCEKCESGTHASQTLTISSRPKLLLLHLKRFIVVEQHNATAYGDENHSPNTPPKTFVPEYVLRKNTDPVSIPDNLSLSSFEGREQGDILISQEESSAYNLISVVHHIGNSASSGHYTADAIRQLNGSEQITEDSAKDTWVSYDDGRTSVTSLNDVTGSVTKQETAYMLLYALDK